MCPSSVSAASTAESSICTVCVTITVRRLSSRSVTTPANSPRSVKGPKRQTERRPTARPREWGASSTTTQASPMFCIQVPATEVSWPKKKSR